MYSFLKFIFLLAFFSGSDIRTVSGLYLQPNLPTLTKAIGEDVSVYCINPDTGPGAQLPEWTDPEGDLIGAINAGGSSHLFVEEDEVNKETKLSIHGLEEEDEGTYTCRLSGSIGETIQIFVYHAIEFTNREEESVQAFEEYDSALVKCTVTAQPKPTIEWYQNGERVYDDQDGGRFSIDPDAGLSISNITQEDEGLFQCRATIRDLSETEALDITVDVQVPPSWLFPPSEEVKAVGSYVEFHCKAEGDPEPTYYWYYDNAPVLHDGVKYSLRDNGEYLTIFNLETDDAGGYRCDADNGVERISAVGDLRVLYAPLGNTQRNLTRTEGQTAVLQCTVIQGGDSLILWEHDGLEMRLGVQPTNSRITIVETIQDREWEMTITKVQRADQGGYVCEIENEVGISRTTHFVFVEYEPTINTTITRDQVYTWVGNPVNVTCHWEGYPTPTVIWKRGGWKLNKTDAVFFNFGNGSSSAQITPDRLDFGSYVCEASNKIARNTHTVDIVEAFPPTEPLGVARGEVSSTTLEIMFDEPEDDGNLPIIGYTVEYWASYDETTIRDEFNETEEVKLYNLNPDTTYFFRVAAENDVGLGRWSENVTAKTITHRPPRKPEIRNSDTSPYPNRIELRWREPEDNGGSPITGYIVRHAWVKDTDVDELPKKHEQQPLNEEAREHIIADLERDQYYFIQLLAKSALGEGEPAEMIIKTGQGTVPVTVKPTNTVDIIVGLETKVLIAVLAAAFIVVLILVDVCCYCVNDCGLLMCVCVQCCGKHTGTHEVDVELAADYSEPYRLPLDNEYDAYSEYSTRKEWSS